MMKVLTVDDSRTIRAVVAHYLSPLGLTVLQAADGHEGLEIMRSAKPDLAIVDVNMPNLDGISMLAMKARDPQIAGIPVMMLTAGADQEFVLRCLKQGARAYIVKPFEKKTLIQKVCKLLKLDLEAVTERESASKGPVVLAVDKNQQDLAALTEILLEGCELVTALDLAQALRLARERRPESIWVDMTMEPEAIRSFVNTLKEEGTQGWVALVNRAAPVPQLAAELGMRTQLAKPFIRLEVREFASRHLGIFQRFLKCENDTCVLQIPGDAAERNKEWLPALSQEVKIGLERAATQGVRYMVVDFCRVSGPADVQLVSGAITALGLAQAVNIQTVLAVPQEDTLKSFTNYQELKGVRCTHSVADALVALKSGARRAA